MVTLDGEIVRPGGSVTGGSDRNRQDDSVLARERELRELPAQLASAEARTAGAVDSFKRRRVSADALLRNLR